LEEQEDHPDDNRGKRDDDHYQGQILVYRSKYFVESQNQQDKENKPDQADNKTEPENQSMRKDITVVALISPGMTMKF